MQYTQRDVQNINALIGELGNFRSAVKCFLKAGSSKQKIGDALFFCEQHEQKIKEIAKDIKAFNL